MLATLAGFLALLLGLSLLLLPLVVTELSRPRDSAWGAVVLLLGLVLVTSAERLTGAPMLAVLCGGLLVGRLGSEVAQARWRALSDEERLALRSADRWSRSLNQLAAAAASLLQSAFAVTAAGSAWLAERRQGRSHGKRWVRAEPSDTPATTTGSAAPAPEVAAEAAAANEADVAVGSDPEGALSVAASPQDDAPVQSSAARVPSVDGRQASLAPDSAAVGESPDAATEDPAPPERDTAQGVDPASLQDAAAAPAGPGVRVVADFAGVDALLAGAGPPDDGREDAPEVVDGERAGPAQA